MQRSFLVLCLLLALASAGCWRSASSDTDANANGDGQALAAYSDPNQALADGTKFLDEGEINKAIDALDQAAKLNPDLAEAWFKLGIAYGLAEKRDETVATEGVPSDETKKSRPNSEKAFEKAVTAYKKLVDANAEDDVAYYNMGRAYNKLGKDEDAERAFKQAVKIKPEDSEYQTELGAILIKLAQYQEAIAPLKKAVELDPENIRAQELLEDAEAGRKRVSYSSTPNANKNANSNSNANTSPANPSDTDRPPPPPAATPARPKPSPSAKPN
ncbi:MAG TPA: tetratricopeptide repeat protein [Pyrinomonadaceae bacterium]|nr:tetratricopeptide repeat protein [Pyrinomonadaceae bacterium]